MDTSKIIKGAVSNGRYTVTAPIVKEDYGLYLQIEDIELPSTYEVDFSNSEQNGTSVTMIGNSDGVLIPHQFIDTGKDIFAFLYHVGEDYGKTVYKFRIPNKLRPDRTDEQPTPEQQSVIDQVIASLNDAVDRAEDAEQAIEDMSVSATTLAEGAAATVTKTEQDGVVHLAFGIPKGQTGDTPTITASKTGDTTHIYADDVEIAQIEDGTDGEDGYSPTASVSKTGKVATITITDKNGTTSAQVSDGEDGTTGATPNITIGTVETLEPTESATASITGTPENPVLNLGIPQGDTGEVTQAEYDELSGKVSDLKSDLTQKANQDGYYADLVSGGSTQLLSDMVATDTTPYNYRTAGGSLEIGDRMKLREIVGASAVVNQIDPIPASSMSVTADGITFTDNRDGSYTFYTDTNGATANHDFSILGISNAVIRGHVYAITGAPAGQSTTTYSITDKFNAVLNYERKQANICKPATNGQSATARLDARLTVKSGCVVTTPITFYLNSFDLTQMFGTTIADYVYSLETATAGAGVAWLRAHFPRIFNAGYVPYNAGELVSVQASAHKMVGFNQWDEEWENGYINDNGQNSTLNTAMRSKNYIAVVPGSTYYIRCPVNAFMFLYDANKTFIGKDSTHGSGGNLRNEIFVIPQSTHYVRFCLYDTPTYNHDICINLHGDGERDGEYEPYKAHSYPLDSSLTLRGLFKLDANSNLYADGDTYDADGTVTRKYGVVDLGTLTWSKTGTSTFYTTSLLSPTMATPIDGAITSGKWVCSKYPYGGGAETGTTTKDNVICYNWNNIGSIIIFDSTKSNANPAEFKAAMSGVYLVYEIATPTTETADPYTEIQNVSNWGTEEFVTTSLVPVGHETAYQPDLRAKIEVAPESPDGDGLYLMKRENGENSYVAYLGELPSDPTTDGTYTLKCTVASGVATKTWEADT